ncbi:hypothetical protein KY360_00795 [Candidatus Woesearchaeota archaeon]|nr:hypothetical protein [Candidatus Woesearchaeota archaeon]
MSAADTILQLINSNGPVLPVHVAKAIGSDILMASAHLSELVSRKKVRVSKIKVGGSPLYYLPGQESKLENFSDNLNEKEKEAFLLLKGKKVLKDTKLAPAHRVALRQLKDFAFPLDVTYNNTKELFWKWHSVTQEETSSLIKQSIALPKPKVQKPEIKREEPAIPAKPKEIQKKIPIEREKKTEKEKPKERKPKAEPKEIQKEIRPKETKEQEITSPFIKELTKYFSKNNIEVIERNIIRKDSEIEFMVQVPSNVGSLTYFCKAKSKKRISDGDLSSVFIQGQTKKLPVLFITKGILTKKAQEMLKNEFKGMTLAQI